MWTQELKRLPQGQGFLIKHTFGKTFRVDKANVFTVRPCPDGVICPVKALDKYIHGSLSMGVDLRAGYLFRPLGAHDRVLDSGFTYNMAYDRLKRYLGLLGLDEGESVTMLVMPVMLNN